MKKKLQTLALNAQASILCRENLMFNKPTFEKEGGDHLVEVLGVIVIAIGILVLFKTQITDLFNKVFNSTDGTVNDLFS